MSKLKIITSGNSVAMRVRPPVSYPNNKNYSSLLQGLLDNEPVNKSVCIKNKARGALLVKEILNDVDSLIHEFPDYYILNFGVVDASTREIPNWMYKYVNKPVKNRLEYLLSGLYSHIIMKHRPFFVKLRRRRSWTNTKKFALYYELLITTLLKETNARIISLSINPADDRVESMLPGSYANHLSFNKIIKETTLRHNQLFLDTSAFVSKDDYPDGVHFSVKGHKLIASRLKEIILLDQKTLIND